jgi:hypothetical protein
VDDDDDDEVPGWDFVGLLLLGVGMNVNPVFLRAGA